MSARHTPGPWFVGAQNDALYVIDRRPAHDNDYPDHAGDEACIARVYDDVRGSEGSGAANARLIAAAPELLERARLALEYLTQKRGPDAGLAASQLRAAIDKALGGHHP